MCRGLGRPLRRIRKGCFWVAGFAASAATLNGHAEEKEVVCAHSRAQRDTQNHNRRSAACVDTAVSGVAGSSTGCSESLCVRPGPEIAVVIGAGLRRVARRRVLGPVDSSIHGAPLHPGHLDPRPAVSWSAGMSCGARGRGAYRKPIGSD